MTKKHEQFLRRHRVMVLYDFLGTVKAATHDV